MNFTFKISSKKIKLHQLLWIIPCVAIITISYYHFQVKEKNAQRNAVIIDVPIDAFDAKGHLVDEKWMQYLKQSKPIGIIFFPEHFQDRNKTIQMVKDLKNILGDNTFFAVDEEGGMIQRIPWVNVPSAMEVGKTYSKLKTSQGINIAKQYVKEVYEPMFLEMQKLGLNMNFAPNLDISFINPDKNKFYSKAVEYMTISRKNPNNVEKEQTQLYQEALLFKSYLNYLGERKLLSYEVGLEDLWKKSKYINKKKLSKQFDEIKKYANYASVIGSRSYSSNPNIVAEIASIFVQTAKKYNINCVAKHALGHGRAFGDTHQGRQIVDTSKNELLQTDLLPYKIISDKIKFVMPSHIIYSDIDDRPATISQKVLLFFKKHISNDVIFISDDMSMGGAGQADQSPCDILIFSHTPLDVLQKQHFKKINLNRSIFFKKNHHQLL